MNDLPKLVYENDDGYVMEWPIESGVELRFTAFEYSIKPKRTSGILLANHYHGGFPTLEEAKQHIL